MPTIHEGNTKLQIMWVREVKHGHESGPNSLGHILLYINWSQFIIFGSSPSLSVPP